MIARAPLAPDASQDSKTRPYKADFSASGIAQMGASIAAFNVLAKFRGYRLIGCVTAGFNAIFLRNDIAPDAFPTLVFCSFFSPPPPPFCSVLFSSCCRFRIFSPLSHSNLLQPFFLFSLLAAGTIQKVAFHKCMVNTRRSSSAAASMRRRLSGWTSTNSSCKNCKCDASNGSAWPQPLNP